MQKAKKTLKSLAAVLFWLAIWQIAAGFINKDLLIAIPTPVSTVKALISGLGNSSLYISALLSILRIAAGFLLALVFGALLGFISAKSELLDTLFSPLLKDGSGTYVPLPSAYVRFN